MATCGFPMMVWMGDGPPVIAIPVCGLDESYVHMTHIARVDDSTVLAWSQPGVLHWGTQRDDLEPRRGAGGWLDDVRAELAHAAGVDATLTWAGDTATAIARDAHGTDSPRATCEITEVT